MGGNESEKNKSIVPRYQHEAWHLLFDNLPAPEVCKRFKEFYDIFCTSVIRTKPQEQMTRSWIRSSKSRMKKQHAWNALFKGLSIHEIVRVMNSVWIDPAYRLIIGIERARRIKIVLITELS